MAPLALAALLVVQGCVTATRLEVEPATVTIVETKPLSVAVVIPEQTRSLAVAHYKRGGCFDLNDVPGNFGVVFADTVRDRFSRLYEQAMIVGSPAEARDADVIFEATLEKIEYRLGCLASPDGMFSADGRLRALDASGRQVWTGTRSRSSQTLGMGMTTDIGADISRRIAGLVDEWLIELQLVPVARYAPGVATTAIAASAPARAAPARRFPRTPVEVAFPAMPPRPDDIAVIIGNADYAKLADDIPDVQPAYADAAGVRKYVNRALGVREGNIIELTDATGSQLIRVFGSATNPRGQLHDWVKPNRSRVFVYYAGHGAPGDSSAYLVPSDADAARIELNGYPLEVLYRNLAALPARSVTVVIEACFSGASQGGTVIAKASPVFVRPKAPPVPANLTVVAAGAADQMASWEPDGARSLFTTYFLKGMAGEADKAPHGDDDGEVGYDELQRYLNDTVTYLARRHYGRDQTPRIVAGGGRS